MAIQAAEVKMPQTSTIQREPSMEEILASIRRIIEDSDQVRKPDFERTSAPVAPRGVAEEIETTSAAFDEPVANGPPFKPSIAARFEEPGARPYPTPAEEPPVAQPTPVSFAPPAEPEFVEAELHEEDMLGAMDDDIDAGLPPAAANTADPTGGLPSKPFESPTIISERTGRQVAAAFEELSDAFAASRRKTFDEIASEMMRPMLQDWLDNNLPTLVEKLVREEIERVARGATR